MTIYFMVKVAGKRKPILERVPYEISDQVITLGDFLTELVHIEVEKYNGTGTDTQWIDYLTDRQIEDRAQSGKVDFGRIYSDKKADVVKAVENALQCQKDGLVRVFQNDTEVEDLNCRLNIQEGDCFTLIRLTFLAGRAW